ncbi:MAG: DUF2530 domain-containing protein [Pseudonocardiaceae bacterium]|nr:DUF2530 domain-containing protein [Pseudonocardiaceae bacterium]
MTGARRDGDPAARRPVPPLPRSLTDARPLVLAATIAWFIGAVVLGIAGIGGDWVWTCVTGGGLGLLGLVVIEWQRRSARRGSRGAQRGLF